jgi:hypothetical protein
MLRHAITHAESRERSSLRDHISCASALGRARSGAGNAAGTKAVAHRNKHVARRGRTTACNGTESAQHRGIPLCVRQPDYGEPRPVATRSGTPQRIDRASAAMVTILVAVS